MMHARDKIEVFLVYSVVYYNAAKIKVKKNTTAHLQINSLALLYNINKPFLISSLYKSAPPCASLSRFR